jgi:AcrR family transcriptional regulator
MASASAPGDQRGPTVLPEGPRRSALLQERSRRTRRALVKAALQLWNARGYERGIEETTAEEIAAAAGVTKGTFYFHFARKEDILRELGWGASAALLEDARAAMAAEGPTREVLDKMLRGLARRVSKVDPVAVRRSVAEFYRGASVGPTDDDHVGFTTTFLEVAAYAARRGELAAGADEAELAALLGAVTLDAILTLSGGPEDELVTQLVRRADVVLAGARAVTEG